MESNVEIISLSLMCVRVVAVKWGVFMGHFLSINTTNLLFGLKFWAYIKGFSVIYKIQNQLKSFPKIFNRKLKNDNI